MDIECKLKRDGGSYIPIEKITYHFAPREDGAHVAFVENEAHQDRFLGIPEAYRVYRGSAAAPDIVTPVKQAVQRGSGSEDGDGGTGDSVDREGLLGSSVHPASFEIHGKTYALGDIVALAHKESGLDAAEWNELEDASRADLIDEQLDKLQADANGDGEVDASEERAALVEQYKAKFGKAPHHKWSADKIREALAA